MQLQKAALGLLSAFSLKNIGRNPPMFGDTVIPVVDVYDQYLAQGELQLAVTGGNLGLTTSNSRNFVVPNGKVWRVIAASMYVGLNAADVALKSVISAGVLSPNSAPLSGLWGSAESVAGGVFRAYGCTLRPPIFLPSGWTVTLGLTTSAAPSVAVPLFGAVQYQEFDL